MRRSAHMRGVRISLGLLIVGELAWAPVAVVAQSSSDTLHINRADRFPCQAALVTGSIFAPDSGQTSFEVRGVLVDDTGSAIVNELVTLWPLTGDGQGLYLGSPGKTNPESATDEAGRFSLQTAAINEDFNVVVGFDINEQNIICSIIPVSTSAGALIIRLAGVPSVVDLGRVVVRSQRAWS